MSEKGYTSCRKDGSNDTIEVLYDVNSSLKQYK